MSRVNDDSSGDARQKETLGDYPEVVVQPPPPLLPLSLPFPFLSFPLENSGVWFDSGTTL